MKVNARIVFADFRKVQGWRWWVTRLLTLSNHTHAHIEFLYEQPTAFIVVDFTNIKAMRTSRLEKMGVTTYFYYPLGEIDISEKDVLYALTYPKANSLRMVLYQAVGRFFGMKQPVSCITFICDFLRTKGYNTPQLFTPRQLMEDLTSDDHYVRWSSPSGQDNASQMAK